MKVEVGLNPEVLYLCLSKFKICLITQSLASTLASESDSLQYTYYISGGQKYLLFIHLYLICYAIYLLFLVLKLCIYTNLRVRGSARYPPISWHFCCASNQFRLIAVSRNLKQPTISVASSQSSKIIKS
jgi:hypothetical protein